MTISNFQNRISRKTRSKNVASSVIWLRLKNPYIICLMWKEVTYLVKQSSRKNQVCCCLPHVVTSFMSLVWTRIWQKIINSEATTVVSYARQSPISDFPFCARQAKQMSKNYLMKLSQLCRFTRTTLYKWQQNRTKIFQISTKHLMN